MERQAKFFADALAVFEKYVSSSVQTTSFRIAGGAIKINFGGDRIGEIISQALVDSEDSFIRDSADSDIRNQLTVFAWDSASTNSPALSAPESIEAFTPLGQITGWLSGRYLAAFEADACALSLFDTEQNVAVYWTRDAAKLPSYVVATPMRSVIQWWMRTRGLELVHGAAVANANGAALLVGPGGAGKSNTALSCVAQGMSYLGDDYCLVSDGGMEPEVFSVYKSAKLYPADCAHFPKLFSVTPSASAAADHDKDMAFLPSGQTSAAPLRMILFLKVTDSDITSLHSCGGKDAFIAIAENTSMLLPYAGKKALQHLAGLVRSLPCFRLELGRDGREEAPLIISKLLNESNVEQVCHAP